MLLLDQVVEGVRGCTKRGSWDFWCWVSKLATSEVVLQNSEKSRQSLVRHESWIEAKKGDQAKLELR